ncbi:hypothetical protein GGF46_002833 [Coemansia sp. RSA 552]|nr:hypothetical protein GGF46_002833 [Coemansia sp. RSA 552]
MNNLSIRIGVVGELGVGKRELVHRICHPTDRAVAGHNVTGSWVGPTVDILDFERRNGQGNAWVEFVVIPSETRHPRSRQMLYSMGLDALFLVCDCTIQQTLLRMVEWIEEATSTKRLKGTPIALVLCGPTPVNWTSDTSLARIIEPLASTYRARIIDVSGHPAFAPLEPHQRQAMDEFFELVIRYNTK